MKKKFYAVLFRRPDSSVGVSLARARNSKEAFRWIFPGNGPPFDAFEITFSEYISRFIEMEMKRNGR